MIITKLCVVIFVAAAARASPLPKAENENAFNGAHSTLVKNIDATNIESFPVKNKFHQRRNVANEGQQSLRSGRQLETELYDHMTTVGRLSYFTWFMSVANILAVCAIVLHRPNRKRKLRRYLVVPLVLLPLCLSLLLLEAYSTIELRNETKQWIQLRSSNFEDAASSNTSLRDLNPSVFIVSLRSNIDRQNILRETLEKFGVKPENTHIVPAILGSDCQTLHTAPKHVKPYADLGVSSVIQHLDSVKGISGIFTDGCPFACACNPLETICRTELPDRYTCEDSITIDVTPTFMERKNAKAEFGSTAAHLKAVLAIYESGVDWGLILEDDASLMLVPEWGNTGLKEVLEELPSNWGVLQLYTWFGGHYRNILAKMHKRLLSGELASRRSVFGEDRQAWGAVAYAVSRSGAKYLLEKYWPGSISDTKDTKAKEQTVMDLTLNPLADILVYSGPNTYLSNRPLFGHQLYPMNSQTSHMRTSAIHQGHQSHHTKSQQRLLGTFYQKNVKLSYVEKMHHDLKIYRFGFTMRLGLILLILCCIALVWTIVKYKHYWKKSIKEKL